MPREERTPELGPRRFVENSKWPRVYRVLGVLLSVPVLGLMIIYRRVAFSPDWSDLGLVMTIGFAYFAVAAGILISASRRRMVLYEKGLSLGELRVGEALGRSPHLAYEAIKQANLTREKGAWTIDALGQNGRRFSIVGSDFGEPEAVLEFLGPRLRHAGLGSGSSSKRASVDYQSI